ncbi:MAG: alanyl-tRNA editing protein [Hyphomicrobiales bacterium]
MIDALYQSDSYLRTADLPIVGLHDDGVLVERSIFYPQGGGQPGDQGNLELASGEKLRVHTTRYGPDRSSILLVLRDGEGPLPEALGAVSVGNTLTGHVDWALRYRFMRVHTALHLLSVVMPYPVTGGQISDGDGRLDFDIADAALDKDALSAQLQALVDGDHPVSQEWITDAELDAQPDLVKTMSVKPPRGSGKVRLVRIGNVDLQPCGGTHVQSTTEIGKVEIRKIENKGKQNRRVRIRLSSDDAV